VRKIAVFLAGVLFSGCAPIHPEQSVTATPAEQEAFSNALHEDLYPTPVAPKVDPCQRSILAFMFERSPITADPKCAYSLNSVKTLQKIEGGYLVESVDYEDGEIPAMLYTSAALQRGQLVGGAREKARYVGTYRYTSLDGFEHNVPAFKVVAP
jgi:hypothetical protein